LYYCEVEVLAWEICAEVAEWVKEQFLQDGYEGGSHVFFLVFKKFNLKYVTKKGDSEGTTKSLKEKALPSV
jgi:hypothetical protein